MADRIDPRPLLDWAVPEARQHYGPTDAAFYALSIGAGQDPLSPARLALVDPWNDGLQPLPTMALVLGYPGFWLGEAEVGRATGIVAARILHVDQSLELERPLPARGDIIGRTRVTGLVDKGAGRDALLYSERRLVDAADGQPVATLRQTHLLRGGGGFGDGVTHWPAGFEAPPRHRPPAGEPALSVRCATRPEQALLYRLNGDANPLHADPAAARAAGLDRPILHGMATLGIAGLAITMAVLEGRPERLTGLAARMSAIVYPGETLQTEIWPEGDFRTIALERDVVVLDGGTFRCRP